MLHDTRLLFLNTGVKMINILTCDELNFKLFDMTLKPENAFLNKKIAK